MRAVSVKLGRSIDGVFSRGLLLRKLLALIANEEKEAIFSVHHSGNPDWSAERRSVLVALQDIAGKAVDNIEVRVRIEVIVAQKLKGAPVPIIGSGLGDDADHTAAVASIFRRIFAFADVEFRDGVRVGIEHDAVIQQIVIQSAIQQKGNRIAASAGDAVTARRAGIAVGFGNARLK